MYISFTGVSIPQLDHNVSSISCWLFFFSLFGRLAVCIILQGCLLALRSYDLRPFSVFQKDSIFLFKVVGDTLMFFSSAPPLPQPSSFQLSPLFLSQLPFLPSELYTQPNRTLLFLPVRLGAAVAFQAL